MVIIPDRLSDLIRKGEITERYYNPGNFFREVHIVMTNNDRPDPDSVQATVGSARLVLHNLPTGADLFLKTAGWRPSLLNGWAEQAVALAAGVKPDLVRCHGARLNAYAACTIKRRLGIPYVVSLHINPDVDVRGGPFATAIIGRLYGTIEKESLLEADLILPVYQPILPFLRRIGATRYRVAYNVINPTHLRKKDIYDLHHPVRVISVGRLIAAKNPGALLAAAASLPNVELTIVGDGPMAGSLRRLANKTGSGSRIIFRPTVRNDELCSELPNYDVFAVHSNYFELSKSVLEAFLTGLPTIINRRPGKQVPELSDRFCLLVDNTVDSYRAALKRLITDDSFRERLGRAAHAHAYERWSPEKCEAEFVGIYHDLVAAHCRAS